MQHYCNILLLESSLTNFRKKKGDRYVMSKVFNPAYATNDIKKISEKIVTEEKSFLSFYQQAISDIDPHTTPNSYQDMASRISNTQDKIEILQNLDDQKIRETALTIHHAETFNFSDAQPNSWIATLLTNKFSIDERSEDFIITLAIYAEAGLINLSYGKDVEAPENNAQQVSNNNNNYIEPDDEDRLSYTEKINKERKDAKYCCAIS